MDGDTQLILLPVEDHWQHSYHISHVYYVGRFVYVAEVKHTYTCVAYIGVGAHLKTAMKK